MLLGLALNSILDFRGALTEGNSLQSVKEATLISVPLTGYFTDAELLDRISFETFPIALTPTLTLLEFMTTVI